MCEGDDFLGLSFITAHNVFSFLCSQYDISEFLQLIRKRNNPFSEDTSRFSFCELQRDVVICFIAGKHNIKGGNASSICTKFRFKKPQLTINQHPTGYAT